jgi:hypothetical protein
MRTILVLAVLCISTCALAQQTILNIPSADVMDKHQLYFRLDSSYAPSPVFAQKVMPNSPFIALLVCPG